MRPTRFVPLAVVVAAGALAAPAAASAATWAVVSSDGTLARGAGVVSTARLGEGHYEVIFNRDVSFCVYNASVGLTGTEGTVGEPAYATTARRDGNANGVFVETVDSGGVDSDFSFHVQVQCATTKPWAVVTKAGALGRGSKVKKVTKGGTGRYTVTFSSNVKKCAYIATVGTGVGGVAEPGLATTGQVSGNANAVQVATYTTGGAPADRPFHLQPICGNTLPWAVAGSGNFLARGAHVTSVHDDGDGNSIVTFDRNVKRCAFIATSGAGDVGTGLAQSVTVVGASGNNRGVYIERLDTGGSPAASTFHLMVQC